MTENVRLKDYPGIRWSWPVADGSLDECQSPANDRIHASREEALLAFKCGPAVEVVIVAKTQGRSMRQRIGDQVTPKVVSSSRPSKPVRTPRLSSNSSLRQVAVSLSLNL